MDNQIINIVGNPILRRMESRINEQAATIERLEAEVKTYKALINDVHDLATIKKLEADNKWAGGELLKKSATIERLEAEVKREKAFAIAARNHVAERVAEIDIKDATIKRLRDVADAATNLVRSQGKAIDDSWEELDRAVDRLEGDDDE